MKKIIKFIIDLYMRLEYKVKKEKYSKIKILSTMDTINKIKEENLSVCRYGDGELKWILGINNNTFQKNDEKMQQRLTEVLQSNDKNILVCLPYVWNNMHENTYSSASYWRLFLHRYYTKLENNFSDKKIYGNASFTRPYMPLKDKKKSTIYFENIKELWRNKDITIVEGKNTKLGVGNNLFENAKSITRILCPATNAFDCYDKILSAILETSKNNLVLIALGPTATILAYDLAKKDYQAIDIGHIDIEYEWFLKKSKKKTNVVGKAVNEVNLKNENVENIYDKNYENSIIKIIE